MNRRQRRKRQAAAKAVPSDAGGGLEDGVKAHRAGRLDEAGAIYRRILAAAPDHADALHLLGLVAHQSGDHGTAAELIGKAIAVQSGIDRFHNSLGLALAALGRTGEAEASYGTALALNPRHVEAHTNLGNLLADQGGLDEAEASYRRALAANPRYAPAHNNLGNVFKQRAERDAAADCYRQAIAVHPDYAEAHRNLALVLAVPGNLDEAEAACRKALEARPNFAEAHCTLGMILKNGERHENAEEFFLRALELRPDYAEAHQGLAFVLWKLGRFEDAEIHGRRAVALWPEVGKTHNVLGLALYDQGRASEAVAAFTAAREIVPRDAAVLNNLGNALTDLGRPDDAEHCYRRAIDVKPDYATAYYGLAALGRLGCDPSTLEALESLAKNDELPVREAINLYFALGAAYAESGDFDRAFDGYRRGNALQKKAAGQTSAGFDPAAHARYIDRLIETFSGELFSRRGGSGHDSDLPVFIVGMPRSGTTLVEQILASHPEVSGQGELPHINRLVSELESITGNGATGADFALPSDAEAARRLGEQYVEVQRASAGDAPRATDKMPTNFFYLGFIALILPRARVIHCRRDPRDTCLSCFVQNFGHNIDFTNDLTDLAAYYRQYRRLMEHWAAVLPLPVLDVQYEDLVSRQEAVSRDIVAFCGLDWDSRCLDFFDSGRPVHTASTLQVRRRIFSSSVNRWRVYERHLAPLIEGLGEEAVGPW